MRTNTASRIRAQFKAAFLKDSSFDLYKHSAEERKSWEQENEVLIDTFPDDEEPFFLVLKKSLAPLAVVNQGMWWCFIVYFFINYYYFTPQQGIITGGTR